MNRIPEPSEQERLLATTLADADFETYSDSLMRDALGVVRRRRRFVQVRRAALRVACVVAVVALGWICFPGKKPGKEEYVAAEMPHQIVQASAHFITEEQMLAMFPKGSCVLAEVNGRKELVFLDEQGVMKE